MLSNFDILDLARSTATIRFLWRVPRGMFRLSRVEMQQRKHQLRQKRLKTSTKETLGRKYDKKEESERKEETPKTVDSGSSNEKKQPVRKTSKGDPEAKTSKQSMLNGIPSPVLLRRAEQT
ncbi:unnamed protein product [Echinostoma caproni]|uniref:Uncharacterized protein n=1 Tax=Echinostoma caproni TaxID=27848 RepID=A0A183A879_9TREM|nr:unnamed protein product [Echinostoma caproni]